MPDFPRYTTERSQLIDQITDALENPMTTKDEIARLHKRLEDGWDRMLEAEQRGGRVPRNWEDVWLGLLAEYQALVDEVETQAEAVEQAALL